MSEKIVVIVCVSREDENHTQDELLEFLGNWSEGRADVEVVVAPHLVDLADDGAVMRRLRQIDGEMLVVGQLQARAIHWLLAKNGLEGPFVEVEQGSDTRQTGAGQGRAVCCLGISGLGATEAVEACGGCLDEIADRLGIVAQSGHKSEASRIEEATSTRWYPVIDFDRCTNCLECLNFCLFGVYGLDDRGSLAIDQPHACRPGCPACSRICPEGAIIFPDHHDPAICGDPRASAGGLKLDLSQLFGGADPTAMAAFERDRAVTGKDAGDRQPPKPPSGSQKTDLDSLVNGLDELEL